MSKLSLLLLIFSIASCVSTALNGRFTKNWIYIIESSEWNSTDENAFHAPLRAIRISTGVYGLQGSIKVGTTIDDNYRMRMRVFRSTTGTSKYSLTPFRLPETSFYTFMSGFYKQFFMNELGNCSNLPVFEGKWETPITPIEFKLNSCVISTKALPTYIQEGSYKIVSEMKGPLFHSMSILYTKVYEP